jgi:hypothetical protein
MKMIKTTIITGIVAWIALAPQVYGQKIDDVRMDRDIEIAENILGTLIKQQFEQERTFFTLEIRGNYQPGYGVTFRLPADYATPIAFTLRGAQDGAFWSNDQGMTYPVGSGDPGYAQERAAEEVKTTSKTYSLDEKKRQKARNRYQMDIDSVRDLYDFKITTAIKSFIIDYGDLVSQLASNERIVVTNKGDQARNIMVDQFLNIQPRKVLSVEGLKSNVMAFKQGKLTRDQALKTISVVNTVPVEKAEPDIELLSTIFTRLYRPDLSKTYFTEENIYYEHLKDFGAVYYMQVYSAWRMDPLNPERIAMPTLGLIDVDPELRDKKAKEMYAPFEQELKVNMLEYGRTLKSLGNEESLIFNVTLTRCRGCGIPATLEMSVKASVLKDFAAGKLDQSAALNKFQIKKGASQ